MPTDDRPLRDVLREIEEAFADGDNVLCETVEFLGERYLERLARELRALAPLLREAIDEMTCNGDPEFPIHCVPCDEDVDRNGELRTKLRTLADELEAKP